MFNDNEFTIKDPLHVGLQPCSLPKNNFVQSNWVEFDFEQLSKGRYY